MSQLTTHILDTSIGKPAVGVKVQLLDPTAGSEPIAEGTTNADGRVADLTSHLQLPKGNYELVFAVAEYFDRREVQSFYPKVTVSFLLEEGQHYHVPLLLNPFGYSTYRGS
ncbi:MAG: hydroxyisourate hydrolase [Bacteroidota bacterium]